MSKMFQIFISKYASGAKSLLKSSLFYEIVILIVLIIIVLFFSFSHILEKPFYYFASDISTQYYPWWVYTNQKLHALNIPSRNEFYLMGSTPYAARGAGVFYPIQWIFHIILNAKDNLDFAYFAFFVQQLMHYILGGVFFYLFTRFGLKLNKHASCLSSLAYVFSGSFMARLVHPEYQQSLVWYPLLFMFFILFVRNNRGIFALLDAVVLSLLILSGHPQIVYYYLGFFLFFAFGFINMQTSANKPRLAMITIGITVWGILLSSIQIIPTLEFTKYAARLYPETTLRNLANSLHPLYYLTMLIPKLFGRHREGYWGSEYPWGNWDNYLYIGVLSSIFLIFSLFWKNKPILRLFIFGAFLSFFLSLGKYFWPSAVANQNMPMSSSLSWVNRITMVFHFFIITLSGIGAHVFLEMKGEYRKYIYSFIFLIVTGSFLMWMSGHPEFVYSLQPAGRPAPNINALSTALESVGRSSEFFFISLFLMLYYLIKRRKWVAYAFIALLLIDLIPVGYDFNPIEPAYSTPQQMYGVSQNIELIKKDKDIFRVDGLEPSNIGLIQNIQTTAGYSTISTQAYQRLIPFINKRYPNLLDMANVKYIVSPENDFSPDHFTRLAPNLWRNDKVLPRVFFSNNAKYIASEQEIIRLMTEPSYDPREKVFLGSIPSTEDQRFEDKSIQNTVNSRIDIRNYSSDNIEVSVELKENGFLFLSEFQYPGWTAYLDGERHDLIPANVSFYALPVPAGKHSVSFQFIPYSTIIGGIISILSLTVTFIVLVIPNYRRSLQKHIIK